MSTLTLKPSDPVLLTARSGDQQIVHTGIILATNVHPKLLGANGQPAVIAVFLNLERLSFSGSADWHKALMRTSEVVHSSHPDWQEGRAGLCYDEFLMQPSSQPSSQASIETAARTAHEVNRIICAMLGEAQPTWAEAPEWQKQSALSGVRVIVANPAVTPEQLHQNWIDDKLADGWTFGPVKDAEKKTHPCLLPYEGLDPGQRAKDGFFGTAVRAVLDLPQLAVEIAGPPAQVTPEAIAAQNAHDRETGNLNELGQTPYEATDEPQAASQAASAEPASEAIQANA